MLKICLFLFSLFAFFNQANAGILLEPYAGFHAALSFEEQKVLFTTGNENRTRYYSGLGYGAKVGYGLNDYFTFFDYHLSQLSMEVKSLNAVTEATTTYDEEQDRRDMGFVFGYKITNDIRVWGGYYFDVNMKATSGPNIDTEINGSAYGAGLGWKPHTYLSINIEYRKHSLDEQISSAGISTMLEGDAVLNFDELIISLSIPLDFLGGESFESESY